jgi:Trypsin-like peptidase domain
MPRSERYSRLAPLPISQQVRLALEAVRFFDFRNQPEKCKLIGKPPPTTNTIQAFSGRDFQTYLERTGVLPEAGRYMFRLRDLLQQLERANLLVPAGQTNDAMLGRRYEFLCEFSRLEQAGCAWLTAALGPEFIYYYFGDGIVQITGRFSNGDPHAGTGLVIAPRWVLTCAHVIDDMTIDEQQDFGGQRVRVLRALAHKRIDVGLLELDQDLSCVKGLAFRSPVIAEPVFALGYPRIPMTRRPALVMQSGQVTSQTQTLIHGQDVFLFSAVARPGNSGGPIVAETGHVVGIVTQQLEEQQRSSNTAPFHAGVDSLTIQRATEELAPSVLLPVETYE